MSDQPASPSAARLATPRWLDTRLVLGVLLVLVSVVVGARLLSSSDRTQLVWAATRDLAIGSELADGDLVASRVQLYDVGTRYLDATRPAPVGYVLGRAVGAGELMPDEALRNPEIDVDFRSVTVSVEPGHFPPDLAAAQKVDVWVTPGARDAAGATAPAAGAAEPSPAPAGVPLVGAQLVLQQLTVVLGPRESGLGGGTAEPVVLQVRPRDVVALVSAMSLGTLDLVRVPRAVEAGSPLVPAGER